MCSLALSCCKSIPIRRLTLDISYLTPRTFNRIERNRGMRRWIGCWEGDRSELYPSPFFSITSWQRLSTLPRVGRCHTTAVCGMSTTARNLRVTGWWIDFDGFMRSFRLHRCRSTGMWLNSKVRLSFIKLLESVVQCMNWNCLFTFHFSYFPGRLSCFKILFPNNDSIVYNRRISPWFFYNKKFWRIIN